MSNFELTAEIFYDATNYFISLTSTDSLTTNVDQYIHINYYYIHI